MADTTGTLELNWDEAETTRQALLSAFYMARDEERRAANTLEGARLNPLHDEVMGRPCDECKIAEHTRTEAARRAMAYGQMAEKVARLQLNLPPTRMADLFGSALHQEVVEP